MQLAHVYDKNQSAIRSWQQKVKNNSHEFLNMFLEMNLVPDLRGLHEWSNWITPPFLKYRFNTLFFTCFLSRALDKNLINLDHNEIMKLGVNLFLIKFKLCLKFCI